MPPEFGPWKTVYNRYNRWAKNEPLDQILEVFKIKMGITSGI